MPWVVKHGQDVEVPDVTEKGLEEARDILQKRGLLLVVERQEENEELPEGAVISQSPPPYSWVKRGRRVFVAISRGARLYEVPDVRGVSQRQAMLILDQIGFKTGTITGQPSYEFPKGVVISQIPEPGELAGKDVLIDLVVSTGPPELALMPDLVGKSLQEASDLLERMGLRLGRVTYQSSLEYLPDTVLRQSIPAGGRVRKGAEIDLVVSKL
ncbi:MAG TPA: PASTA domain-containing protein [Candidatus Latescibacteria bacterium]|nr:PASTA domain-containing protein [Candidatus Latescibacterota bacterium]